MATSTLPYDSSRRVSTQSTNVFLQLALATKGRFYDKSVTEPPSLQDICIDYIRRNVSRLGYIGPIPSFLAHTFLDRATPAQLYRIEKANPDYDYETEPLWEKHVKESGWGVDEEVLHDQCHGSYREYFIHCLDRQHSAKLRALAKFRNAKSNEPKETKTSTMLFTEVPGKSKPFMKTAPKSGSSLMDKAKKEYQKTLTERRLAGLAPSVSHPPPYQSRHTPSSLSSSSSPSSSSSKTKDQGREKDREKSKSHDPEIDSVTTDQLFDALEGPRTGNTMNRLPLVMWKPVQEKEKKSSSKSNSAMDAMLKGMFSAKTKTASASSTSQSSSTMINSHTSHSKDIIFGSDQGKNQDKSQGKRNHGSETDIFAKPASHPNRSQSSTSAISPQTSHRKDSNDVSLRTGQEKSQDKSRSTNQGNKTPGDRPDIFAKPSPKPISSQSTKSENDAESGSRTSASLSSKSYSDGTKTYAVESSKAHSDGSRTSHDSNSSSASKSYNDSSKAYSEGSSGDNSQMKSKTVIPKATTGLNLAALVPKSAQSKTQSQSHTARPSSSSTTTSSSSPSSLPRGSSNSNTLNGLSASTSSSASSASKPSWDSQGSSLSRGDNSPNSTASSKPKEPKSRSQENHTSTPSQSSGSTVSRPMSTPPKSAPTLSPSTSRKYDSAQNNGSGHVKGKDQGNGYLSDEENMTIDKIRKLVHTSLDPSPTSSYTPAHSHAHGSCSDSRTLQQNSSAVSSTNPAFRRNGNGDSHSTSSTASSRPVSSGPSYSSLSSTETKKRPASSLNLQALVKKRKPNP